MKIISIMIIASPFAQICQNTTSCQVSVYWKNLPNKFSIPIYVIPAAAGCGKFAEKPIFAYFKMCSQDIKSRSEISKLLTFPTFESDDKNFS